MTACVHDCLLSQKLCLFSMLGWSVISHMEKYSLAQSVLKQAARQYARWLTTAAGSGVTRTCLIESMCLHHKYSICLFAVHML